MTGSFTPGPWHVVPYGDGDSLVICSDQGGEWRICFMATHGGTASVWEAIQANASLIAAAPELLDKLQIAVGVIKAAKIVWMGLDAAEAAIAKATSPGGEQ